LAKSCRGSIKPKWRRKKKKKKIFGKNRTKGWSYEKKRQKKAFVLSEKETEKTKIFHTKHKNKIGD
jgi:hypothetical protein